MYKKYTNKRGVPKGYVRQILLIMRLTTIILIMGIMQVSASTFAQRITLSEKNATLSRVFDRISDQCSYDFVFNSDLLKGTKPVTISVKDTELDKVLEQIFHGQPLSFSIEDKTVVVKAKQKGFFDNMLGKIRPIDVRGKVLDEKGEPLVGATVKVEELNKSAKTNAQGEFYITGVEESAWLEISFVGYKPFKTKVIPDLGIIRLELDNSKLEEVEINAGYYTVKDQERTSSIARVGSENLENQPVTNALSAVQGRMAGVNITQNTGTPGGGFRVLIRGQNSLRTLSNTGTEVNVPLYVVDGVPLGGEVSTPYGGGSIVLGSVNPLNAINPNQIESIEVLKDADATAIYGSRGANGVILIVTKKGRTGKPQLTLNSSYGFSKALSNLQMMNTDQYLQMREQAFANAKVTTYPSTAYDINGTWDKSRYTDWKKELIGNTAMFSNSNLSLNGGSDQTTYLLSLGHNQQTTVFDKRFKYKTYNLSNSINHRSKDSKFQLALSHTFSMQHNNVLNGDITSQVYRIVPNAPALYKADGSLNWENNTFTNPVAAYEGTYGYQNIQYLQNINTQYEILPNFITKFSGGINYQTFEEESLRPNTVFNPAFATGQSSAYSSTSISDQNRFSFILEPQLNWHWKQGSHELNVLAGTSYQQETNNRGSMTGTGFESNVFMKNISAAQNKTIGDRFTTVYKYAAIFGRINYQMADRYIVNITGRRDGSSRFGPNNKYGNFGAVGVAWLFSKEDLFKDLTWLSFGKLRGSFGTTGSDNIGDYQFNDTYSVSTLAYNMVTGLVPSRLLNPDFSWEKTSKLEIATDFGLFSNRLNMTAAWYQNRSSSQLVGYQLPAITGFPSVQANLNATVENSGWELELSAHPLKFKNFRWETALNVSFPKNKLLSFPGLAGSTYSSQFVIGQPTSIVRLYRLEGINPQTQQYIFTDFNGDNRISSQDDRQTIRNLGTTCFGGWHNSFNYNNWNLSVLLQFVKQVSRNYNYSLPTPGAMINMPVEVLNVYSAENPNGFYMPYTSAGNTLQSLFQSSTAGVSDASFLRLKNVDLGYRVPLKGNLAREFRVYFQAQNMLTWSKYFGFDPETGSGSFLPALKTYSFGLQCNF